MDGSSEHSGRSVALAPAVVWGGEALPAGVDPVTLLGQKGATLHAMAAAGVNVPPFFIVTTAAGGQHLSAAGLDDELLIEIRRNEERLEEVTRKALGDEGSPLLLAVRCSAAEVPAGLLPSVMNLGLSRRTAHTLFSRTADDRFVYDCYRKLIAQYARLVHDVDPMVFDRELRREVDNRGLESEAELDGPAMQELTRRYLDLYSLRTGREFPEPYLQLRETVQACLRVGSHPRIMAVRRRTGEMSPLPVAVIVQAMVFGNRARESFAGVAYTRDPRTGENQLTGEVAEGSQGGDVVHGRVEPQPLEKLRQSAEVYQQLVVAKEKLERQFRDALEIEFTVEQGSLWILQVRPMGRSGEAAIRMAVELAETGIITQREAVAAVRPEMIEQMMHARFDLRGGRGRPTAIASGFAASPGAAVGKLAFSAADALRRTALGEAVILVRRETDASDVIGMQQCQGILTSTGGMTSHAAVVARGMGRCCVVGAGDLEIDERRQEMRVGGRVFGPDDEISLDGASGEVYPGAVKRVEGQLKPVVLRLLEWADGIRKLGVYANCDTPEDVKLARSLGAEGVGLCRTEHMFFEPQRITAMRKMILAGRDDVVTRESTLGTLLEYQRVDFVAIFRQMEGRTVVVRLLDPPLHEFLPHDEGDQRELAKALGLSLREVKRRIEQLHEVNPMLGHRGCRLLVSHPEIMDMQVQAIIEATIECSKRTPARPWIMVPLTIGREEMTLLAGRIRETADRVMREEGVLVEYQVGSMIETPRAALLAGEIAQEAQFFSFGTNDLTQTVLAISRDDAGKFMADYDRHRLLPADPFRTVDVGGVGELVKIAIERGRAVREGLSCGVCGEHGGDPASIAFFHGCGVDYVSCSPMRLPIARLAAAHAAMKEASRD